MYSSRLIVLLIMLVLWLPSSTFAGITTTPDIRGITPTLPFFKQSAASPINTAQAQRSIDHQRAMFIENKGQWDRQVRFLMRSDGIDTWITERGVRYDLYTVTPAEATDNERDSFLSMYPDKSPAMTRSGHVIGIAFEGTAFAPKAQGVEQLPGAYNYFIGNDRSKWATGVRLFAEARLESVYNGVDAVFYLEEGKPRYDLVIAPGADPTQIRMKVKGSNGVSIGRDGALCMATSMGILQQAGLYAYQELGKVRRQIACQFTIGSDQVVRFEIGEYDRSKALVIDPLVYSTYMGSPTRDLGHGIALDSYGNTYVVGATDGAGFPSYNAYQDYQSNREAFVTKLTYNEKDGVSLVYSTYLGGGIDDEAYGIAVDPDGNAYVSGNTGSADFPVVNQYMNDQLDVDWFVAKLVQDGTGSVSLAYSTYIGGSKYEHTETIAVDSEGNAYVAGSTHSTDLPIVNEFQGDQDGIDGYVVKLVYSGSGNVQLGYATYLGGNVPGEGKSADDICQKVGVDAYGNLYVLGWTRSKDFPTLHPLQEYQQLSDLFVAKLVVDSNGQLHLGYSTYLGGNQAEYPRGLAVDAGGAVYVAGTTYSSDFPTQHAYKTYGDAGDVTITKIIQSSDDSIVMVFSTYLGGIGNDDAHAVAVGSDNAIYVAGATNSNDFPTEDEFQSNQPDVDAFITKMVFGGDSAVRILYSTYLGGNGGDQIDGIAVDSLGYAVVVGTTYSTDFPLMGAYQSDQPEADIFITKVGLTPHLDVRDVAVREHYWEKVNSFCFPNPAQDNLCLNYLLLRPSLVTIEIFSADGRIYSRNIDRQMQEAGDQRQVILLDQFPPGAYFLYVTAGTNSFVERFVIVH